jgi:hypothetical protein
VDLCRERATWSPATYKITQRDLARGPVKLGALHRYVAAQDEAATTDAVQTLLRRHRPVDCLLHLCQHRRTNLLPVHGGAGYGKENRDEHAGWPPADAAQQRGHRATARCRPERGDAYGKALQAMADEDGAMTCRIGDYLGPWAAGRPVAGVSP